MDWLLDTCVVSLITIAKEVPDLGTSCGDEAAAAGGLRHS